jgi:hypothetical protein
MTESGNGYRADLLALPTDWRLVRVGRHKEPIAGDNWFDADNFSGDEAAGLPGSGPPAWGLKSGPVSGVVVLDLDAEGWRESFQQQTCHPITDLPSTIGWTSGKPGRSGHAFQVDPDWWPHLVNRRCWVNANGRTCWELRGDRHQSVILGAHPETSGYRWLPGRSPVEIPDPAAAPDWLLEALLVQELPNLQPLQSNEDDAARAAAMLEHLPAADYCSYDSWLRVGMALHHTDPGLLADWVDWCKAMPNFDEAECLAKWKSFGKGHMGQPATIATLHHLAKQHGYREPKRSQKPDVSQEHQKTHPAAAAHEHMAMQQQEGEKTPRADQLPRNPVTPAEKLADLQGLASKLQADRVGFAERLPTLRHRAKDIELPIRDIELLRLLSAARRRRLGMEGLLGPGDVLDLSPQPWAWQGLLLRGCLNLLVAEPKQGKTSLLVAMIAAWHRGAGTFLGRELSGPCPPVLLIGTDQGSTDWGRMLQPAGLLEGTGKTGRILAPIVGLAHSGRPVHLDPEGIDMIAEKAQRHPGLLVVIDSLSACIAPLGLKEESPEIAMPVGELMEQLEPHGATVALIHHASKGRAGDSATRASRGSTALPALASQILKLAPATPNNPRDNRRLLTTEGRGGSPQALVIEREGSTWVLHGGIDDLEQERQQAAAINRLTDRQTDVLDVLRDRWADHQQQTTSADVVDALGLAGKDPQGAVRQTLQQLARKGLVQCTRLPGEFGKRGAHAFWPLTEMLPMPSRGGFENRLGSLRSLCSDALAHEDPHQTEQSGSSVHLTTEATETTEAAKQAPAREGESISVVGPAVNSRPTTTTGWVRLALRQLGLAPHVAMVSRVMAWLEQTPEHPACTRSAVTAAMARLQEEDNDNETAAPWAA